MDVRGRKTKAIVLRNRDFGDSNTVLIVLTKEYGKMPLVARGFKKQNSSLKASCQLFTESNIVYSEGKSMGILTQGEVINGFANIREDILTIAYGCFFAEMIDISFPDFRPNDEAYMLLISSYILLNEGLDPYLTSQYFIWQLMKILGYTPYLKNCTNCHKDLRLDKFYLQVDRGCIFCDYCNHTSTSLPISTGAIKLIETFIQGDLKSIFRLKVDGKLKDEVDFLTKSYSKYYIDRSEKAFLTLETYL